MSKELIDRLKSYIPSGDGHNSQYANDLADAVAILEAKAAPAGEREAFEAWWRAVGLNDGFISYWSREAFQAGAAYQRAQQPQSEEAVAYTTAGMLAIAKELPLTGRIGARCKADDRWNVPLYTAPQPSAAPDAVTMADVMRAWEYAEDHPHKYLRGTTNWCAAVAHSLNQRNPSAPATVQGDGWIPVSERLPESERTVLAFYLNSHGKGRRVRAEYIAAKTKSADDGWDSDEPADYDEQADEYFWPAGWYEVMDNWDDLTHMVIHEGEATHWMPLPESPAIAAARQEAGKA